MSAPWLATLIDRQMLATRGSLYSALDVKDAEPRSGSDIAQELQGRPLLRYVLDEQVHEAVNERDGVETFVTITPYGVDDLAHYLALPMPHVKRRHVILLNPSAISVAIGPCFVAGGEGIEYVHPNGYTADAVLSPGWAVEVR